MFTDVVLVVSAAQFGSAFDQPIFLDQLNCDGSESELFECGRHTGIGLHTCDHLQDVGLRCRGEFSLHCTYSSVLYDDIVIMTSTCVYRNQ